MKAAGGPWEQIQQALEGSNIQVVDLNANAEDPQYGQYFQEDQGVPQVYVVPQVQSENAEPLYEQIGFEPDTAGRVLAITNGSIRRGAGRRSSGRRRKSARRASLSVNNLAIHVLQHCQHNGCLASVQKALACAKKCCYM